MRYNRTITQLYRSKLWNTRKIQKVYHMKSWQQKKKATHLGHRENI